MNSAKGFNLEYKTIYYRFNFSFTIQLFVSLLSLSTNRASQQSVNLFFLSVYNGWVQKAHTTILYPINFLDPILPSNFEPKANCRMWVKTYGCKSSPTTDLVKSSIPLNKNKISSMRSYNFQEILTLKWLKFKSIKKVLL